MNTGTTSNKNVFGVILLVVSLYTFWRVVGLWREKNATDRRRHADCSNRSPVIRASVVQDGGLGNFAWLLLFLEGRFILIANRRAIKRQPARLHALVLMLLAAGIMLFRRASDDSERLGRQSNLSGRTDIWAAVIPAAQDPLIGAGYESFWKSPDNVAKFAQGLVGW